MNWKMARLKNVEHFYDTQKIYTTELNEYTVALCENTQVYKNPVKELNITDVPAQYDTKIIISSRGTVMAAYDWATKGFHVAALNFAAALTPGGSVLAGAFAQEENICRCSNLYASLTLPQANKFYYNYNKRMLKKMPYYTDALIYSPNVCIFKDDVTYNYIKPKFIDIITCPSASAHKAKGMTTEELRGVLTYRLMGIIKSAIYNRAEVLILGAWGCGAFGQNPKIMAEIFKTVLSYYNQYFKVIEFAIRGDSDNNRHIFESVFTNVRDNEVGND